MTPLDAALSYAAAGWPVIPLHTPNGEACDCANGAACTSPAKHPRTLNGLKNATTDAQRITGMWTRWPTANVGLVIPEGAVAVDVDGPEGVDAIKAAKVEMPMTAVAKTGRGWHYVYSTERPIRPAVGILDHVDLRGPGSYIVAPPSIHANGRRYVWKTPFEDRSPAPAWIAEKAGKSRQRDLLPADPAEPIREGERNAHLASLAGSMRHRGFPEAAIRAALLETNRSRCVPPLVEDEVAAIAASVARYAPAAQANGTQPKALRFYTPAELAALTLPTPDWLIPGFLAVQAITEIDGKIKKAGKTTFALHMVRSVLDGLPFLGLRTRETRVLYVTEQSRQTFMDALRRAGLADRTDEIRVLFREDLRGMTWSEVVARVQEEAVAGNRDLVVVDTIGKLAGIVSENDAGEWSAAMSPLQDLAASGRALLLARHDRKSGGDVGESGRGSSQASGDVDIILQLRRPEGNQPTTRRVLESASRYPDTPEKVVIELTEEGYAMLGAEEAVATSDAREMLVAAIGVSSAGNDAGATREKLVELGKQHEPRISEWAIRQALDALVAEKVFERLGHGKKGSPYMFRQREIFLSGVTQNLGPQETNGMEETEGELLEQVTWLRRNGWTTERPPPPPPAPAEAA